MRRLVKLCLFLNFWNVICSVGLIGQELTYLGSVMLIVSIIGIFSNVDYLTSKP